MDECKDLSEIERLLLMAAAVQGLGPATDLGRANTARVVRQVLRWRGMSDEQIQASLWQEPPNALTDKVYDALVRMTQEWHEVGPGRAPERPGPPLFEGGGNWGVPGDPEQPPCMPFFNSCRLTALGERIAQQLLARNPEYCNKD